MSSAAAVVAAEAAVVADSVWCFPLTLLFDMFRIWKNFFQESNSISITFSTSFYGPVKEVLARRNARRTIICEQRLFSSMLFGLLFAFCFLSLERLSAAAVAVLVFCFVSHSFSMRTAKYVKWLLNMLCGGLFFVLRCMCVCISSDINRLDTINFDFKLDPSSQFGYRFNFSLPPAALLLPKFLNSLENYWNW